MPIQEVPTGFDCTGKPLVILEQGTNCKMGFQEGESLKLSFGLGWGKGGSGGGIGLGQPQDSSSQEGRDLWREGTKGKLSKCLG